MNKIYSIDPGPCLECGQPTDDPSGICEACQEEIALEEAEAEEESPDEC